MIQRLRQTVGWEESKTVGGCRWQVLVAFQNLPASVPADVTVIFGHVALTSCLPPLFFLFFFFFFLLFS